MSSAVASQNENNWFETDAQFHNLYPLSIRLLAVRHWTPLHVTQRVVQYLTPVGNENILDIGSGVGKFCMAAANSAPSAFFFGVEQRNDLVKHADAASKALGLSNIRFIHGNFTQLDFKLFDHFYFYNSFYENLIDTDKIDDRIDYSVELYNYYNRQLYNKLKEMPSGTRVVTFHSLGEEIPSDYHLVEAQMNDLLKFWIKK
ncbi:MAG: methyltransferase [Sphingobacteriales bacterium 50-39]|nr:methyltransferase domain-containing protein [Sphingobacteriales bacterium]OJW61007.1 MAG: methyltransferase [Sphingobacteriales bacterium 50-39]